MIKYQKIDYFILILLWIVTCGLILFYPAASKFIDLLNIPQFVEIILLSLVIIIILLLVLRYLKIKHQVTYLKLFLEWERIEKGHTILEKWLMFPKIILVIIFALFLSFIPFLLYVGDVKATPLWYWAIPLLYFFLLLGAFKLSFYFSEKLILYLKMKERS